MFDVRALTCFAEAEIQKFAMAHQDETFYAFAIDAQLLSLRSEQYFPDLPDRQEAQDPRSSPEHWKYQGFAVFGEQDGFDEALYSEHYSLDKEQQKTSHYAAAMDEVMRLLTEQGAFETLRRDADFLVVRVEHVY